MNQVLLLLATEWPAFLNKPDTLVLLIPIVAMLVPGILGLAKLLIRHRERMAMIQQGMHPDHPSEDDDTQANSQ